MDNSSLNKVEVSITQDGEHNVQHNYFNFVKKAKELGIPINLPMTNVTFFAGRETNLKELHELLQRNQQVAIAAYVEGMGGVGKTELAIQYALRHVLDEYSGGVCWLRGEASALLTTLPDFVRVHLNIVIPDDLNSEKALMDYCWKRLADNLQEKKMLVVIDDVKDYEAIKPYLPPIGSGFRVLATTRQNLGTVMQQYKLKVLLLPAAVDLLRSFLLPEATPAQQEMESLCEWLGKLPLAIELVGRYLAKKPDLTMAEMLKRLKTKRLEQDALTDKQRRSLTEMTAELNVIAAFDLSWQELSADAQELACTISLFALAPVPWHLVEAAIGNDDAENLENCRDDQLLNFHLLERTAQGVYQLHQLLREYFQFQLQKHLKQQLLRQQVVQSLLNISKQIPQTPTLDQIAIFKPAIPHLELLNREMIGDIANPEQDLVWAFVGVAKYYQGQGLYALAEVPYQDCLSATEQQLGAEHPSTAASLNNLAGLYNSQGRYSEAEPLYVRALQIKKQQLGVDHPDTATSLNNLALLYDSQRRYSEAELLLVCALQIMEQQLGADHPSTATSLNNLALLYDSQGRYSEAEPLYVRALQIWEQQLGADHPDTAKGLNNLAFLYEAQGKYTEAQALAQRALAILQSALGNEHPNTQTVLLTVKFLQMQILLCCNQKTLVSILQALAQQAKLPDLNSEIMLNLLEKIVTNPELLRFLQEQLSQHPEGLLLNA